MASKINEILQKILEESAQLNGTTMNPGPVNTRMKKIQEDAAKKRKRLLEQQQKEAAKKKLTTKMPTTVSKKAKPLDLLGNRQKALDERLASMGSDPLTWLQKRAMQSIQTVKPADESLNRYGYATAEQNIKQKKQVQAPFNEKYVNPGNSTARKAVTELAKPIAGAGAFIGGNLAKGLLVNQVEGLPTTAAGVRAWFQNLVGDKEGSKNTLDMVDNPDAPLVYDANGKQRPYKETGGNYLYVQDGKKWKLVPYKAGDQGKFYTKASGMFGDIYSKYDGQGSIELQKGNDLITQGLSQMQGNEVYDKLNETGAGGIMLKDIVQGVGEQGWNAAFQAVAPGAGYAIMGVNSAGNKIRERADQGDRDINNIMANAGLSGAATALIEKTSGGLGGFGKTNPVVRGLTKNIKSILIKNGIKVAGNVIGESGEEVEDAFAQGVIDYFLNNKEDKTIAQLFADNKPLEAAISAAIISGLTLGGSGVNATTNGVDIETGLSNEQTKFVEGLAKSQKNEKGESIGFDKAVEVYQKNKALESQIGFTPDFDERAVAPEDAKNIPLRFTQTGNKRVDDFNAMQAKVLKNTPEDRNQAYNNIRTVMELGIDEFILSDKEVQQMNKPAGTGAFWNEKLNAVVVNAETKRSFASKLFHEFAHIRENSSVQSELANMVIAYRNANPTTLKDGTTETAEQEMARIKSTYEKAGVQLSEQGLRNEFVAEELARLSDKDAKFYQSVFNESPTVFQKLGQYVQKKLGFLKEGSEEQRYFKKIQELQKKAYDEVKYQRKQKAESKNSSDKNLIEYGAKTKEEQAIEYFGTTSNYKLAGYLTKSGKMLDFSGVKDGADGRNREMDHREINAIYGYKGTGTDALIEFVSEGNIRIIPYGFEINKEPTLEQYIAISNIITKMDGIDDGIDIDIANEKGDIIKTIKFDGNTSPKKIINDLKTYFNKGVVPGSRSQTAQFRDKYLIEDNLGRELSKGQQEFFKDSKVRDEEGRLLTVYHGTNNVFTKFKKGKRGYLGGAIYLSDTRSRAKKYTDYDSIHELYADVKNPVIAKTHNATKEVLNAIYGNDDVFNKRYKKLSSESDYPLLADNASTDIIKPSDIKKLIDIGYDGVIWDFADEKEIAVFSPNQIKSIDNLNPTEDDDIRYLIEDPRLEGDFSDISDRATKSMVKQFPELAPYLKEMAGYMQMEVEGGFRGGRSVSFDYNGDAIQTGGKRFVIADDIASILDSKIIKSYAHLSETLQDIQNGEGWNAAAKYLEMYLDERLTNGYTTDGMDIPPNEAYVGMKEMLKKGIVDNTVDGQLPYTPDKWNEYEPTGKDQAEYEAMQGLAPMRKEPSQKDVDEYAEMQGLVPIREDLKPNKFTAMKESSAKALSELEKARDTIVSDYNQKINQAKIELHKKKRLSKQGANLQARIIRLEKMRDDRIAEFDARIERQGKQTDKREISDKEQQRILAAKARKSAQLKEAEEIIGDTINSWKDKAMGLGFSTEHFYRNIYDVVGRNETADKIIDTYYRDLQKNVAGGKKFIKGYKDKIKALKLNNTESRFTQMLGEFRHNPETTLKQEDIDSFMKKYGKKIDQAKVDRAIKTFRQSYDELFQWYNAKAKALGLKEIEYRQGYFPHFIESEAITKFGKALEAVGFKVKKYKLKTDIQGLTENFKPNQRWLGQQQSRKTDITDYNALESFEMYIEGVVTAGVTLEPITKLRAFEEAIRYRFSEEGVRAEVDRINELENISEEEKDDLIDKVYERYSGQGLGNFVSWLRDYTNGLSNKKQAFERWFEGQLNRTAYGVMDQIQSRVAANMVGMNISSALTNFIPIAVAAGEVNPIGLIHAMEQTMASAIKDDGFAEKSVFLTNRFGDTEKLYRKWNEHASDVASMLFTGIDHFTAETIVRGKYNQNIKQGMSEEQSMKDADAYAESVIGGRSLGEVPTLFNSKMAKPFTMFQLEVNNQLRYMFKDLPAKYKGEPEKWLYALLKIFMGSFLYNLLGKKIGLPTQAFSPIDIAWDAYDRWNNENLSTEEKVWGSAEDIIQEVPFVGGLFGGGRIPVNAALPSLPEVAKNLIRMTDEDKTATAWKNLEKEMKKPLFYLVPPFGGGQLKKTIEGLDLFNNKVPGSYTPSGDLRFEVEDKPINRVRAAIFGQWSLPEAKEYVDNGFQSTTLKTLEAAKEADLAPTEYKKIKKKAQEIDTNKDGKSTYEEKLNYLESLDIPVDSKTALANDLAPTREYKVDMKEYDKMSGLEEYDLYLKDRGQWEAITNITNYMHYKKIESNIEELTSVPEMENESTSVRAQAVYDYVMSTNLDYDKKLMLIKSKYSNYNYSTAKKYEPYIAELDKVVLDSIDSMKISKEAKKSLASKYKFKYFEWRGYGW